MKTTNKILLATLIAFLAVTTVLIVIVRLNISFRPLTEGSMNVVSEIRQISDFNAIEASGPVKVELVQGDEIGLTIEADDNLIELIVTEVNDKVLTIRMRERVVKYQALDIKVAFVTLEALRVSAGASVFSLNTIVGLALKHIVSSGATSELNLDLEELTLEVSSGARAKLSGKVRELFIESSSGSEVMASELQAENASIKTSSGSVNHVFVNNEMSIDASSGAVVSYGGSPTIKGMKTSSGGSVGTL
ncbi:MAG: DUF2807 domain-containing protein [Bacteroidales bacterium]|nr:DUF2807 domain-containing protein [Bacteroidales bacterium]